MRVKCERKAGIACSTCRTAGKGAKVVIQGKDDQPVKPATGTHPQATSHEIGAAVDMYFDGLSYRRMSENIDLYFGRETNTATVYRWVHGLTDKAGDVVKPLKVDTGKVWVADEIVVNVGGKNYWLFNVMDSDSRFILSASFPRSGQPGRRQQR